MAAGNDSSAADGKKSQIMPGDIVLCKTNLGEEYEGEVMGYEDDSKALILKTDSSNGKAKPLCNIVILNLSLISEGNFTLISKSENTRPALPDIDHKKLEERLMAAKAKVGIGVSAQAQQLFNHISKTIPCIWHGANIIALETVHISSPYKVENCSTTNDEQLLNYIKSIVKKFYASLSKSNNAANVSPT